MTSEALSGRTNTTGPSCFLDQKIVRKHGNLLLRDLKKHPSTAVDVLQLAGAAPRGTWRTWRTWTASKCWEGTAGIATLQPEVFIFLSFCFPHLNSEMFHVVTVMHQSTILLYHYWGCDSTIDFGCHEFLGAHWFPSNPFTPLMLGTLLARTVQKQSEFADDPAVSEMLRTSQT